MDEKDPNWDTFHPEGILPDGGVLGRRRRGDQEVLTCLKPVRADDPPTADDEVVRLRRGSRDGEMRVESLGKGNKGPAKFTTPKYRNNYDGIFGAKHQPAVS